MHLENAVCRVGDASHVWHLPNLREHVRLHCEVLAQEDIRADHSRVADDADAGLVLGDLQTLDDVHDKLLGDVPVHEVDTGRRVDHEDHIGSAVSDSYKQNRAGKESWTQNRSSTYVGICSANTRHPGNVAISLCHMMMPEYTLHNCCDNVMLQH